MLYPILKFLKSKSHLPKGFFYMLQQKLFKSEKFHLRNLKRHKTNDIDGLT